MLTGYVRLDLDFIANQLATEKHDPASSSLKIRSAWLVPLLDDWLVMLFFNAYDLLSTRIRAGKSGRFECKDPDDGFDATQRSSYRTSRQ